MTSAPNNTKPEGYEPDDKERKWLGRIDRLYTLGWQDRRPHEGAWFRASSNFRGNFKAFWNESEHRLVTPIGVQRSREDINLFQRKVLSRRAKFLRNRDKPECVAATSDIEDKLNARLTAQALRYQQRNLRLESLYDQALMWANLCSHGYWWFHWDPNKVSRIKEITDPFTGEKTTVEAQVGDIRIEVGSPFEVLVADPSIAYIGDQPAIMRMKIRDVEDIKALFKDSPNVDKITGTAVDDQTQTMAKYIAGLASGGWTGAVAGSYSRTYGKQDRDIKNYSHMAMVREMFVKPCAEYLKGAYAVECNGILLTYQEELPEGFYDLPNPYPCVDFVDTLHPGQYWGSTVADQLIGVQASYNRVRDAIQRSFERMGKPKLLVTRSHGLDRSQWTEEEGEIVETNFVPGVGYPMPWSPPAISGDAWRLLDTLRQEYDTISGIHPESEGAVGKATSGFQTNLLQEATDSIHQPDIQAHQAAKEDAYRKIRRMMKQRYLLPRLLTIAGRNKEPEVFEFSEANIDENADIILETGSMLPDLKSARIQAVLELFGSGILGPVAERETYRKAQQMLEFGSKDEIYDPVLVDEERARLENLRIQRGEPVPPALAFDDHERHTAIHTEDFKKAANGQLDPNIFGLWIDHIISHARWINPQAAAQLAAEYGRSLPPPPGTPMGAPQAQGPAPSPNGPPPQAPDTQAMPPEPVSEPPAEPQGPQ